MIKTPKEYAKQDILKRAKRAIKRHINYVDSTATISINDTLNALPCALAELEKKGYKIEAVKEESLDTFYTVKISWEHHCD